MVTGQQYFLESLSKKPSRINIEDISIYEKAKAFIHAAHLTTVTDYLKEQLWLSHQEGTEFFRKESYNHFLSRYFENELLPLAFLKEYVAHLGEKELKNLKKESINIEAEIISSIRGLDFNEQRIFLETSFNEMMELFLKEEKKKDIEKVGQRGPCLYRSFDNIDKFFNLDYQLDREMKIDHQTTERLYQGAGIGVQSGYSTILLAIHHLDIKEGGVVVDLGSGYGRVGLVYSLLRADIKFTGYEYVPHRVDVSNKATEFLHLNENLNFITQDLSIQSFKIPIADVYYLYDPFSDDTYQYILDQIIFISEEKDITVVTKGNANKWLMKISKDRDWPSPLIIDEGNLCIFKNH